MKDARRLIDLAGVGPAAVQDFAVLGIRSVAQLVRRDPRALYEELCARTGARHDPCVEDVFAAAVAQAQDPDLPAAERQWWYWSGKRRERDGKARQERLVTGGTRSTWPG